MIDKFRYTETFVSCQGEGHHTGKASTWVRFFLCNLACSGMGQEDPTNPDTYKPVGIDLDISNINNIKDVPVLPYGCDSAYSVAKKFKHLAYYDTAEDIVNKLEEHMKHPSNPDGKFIHPATGQDFHFCMTGGEPMLKQNQKAITAILNEMVERKNVPINFTVETNGTQIINEGTEFYETVRRFANPKHFNWFWSVSPKLWSTAGEKSSKAIVPEAVASYYKLSPRGQLKYVVNGSKESWEEVEEHTARFREAGVGFPVWIMSVGATKESQENGLAANIAVEAMKRGYHFSGRLHCSLFGNEPCT